MSVEVSIKLFIRTVVVILFSALGMIAFSPYGSNQDYKQKAIIVETEINSSISEVYGYLGESENASQWSTFVTKIMTLNGNSVLDGEVGSKRRCFGKQHGVVWDEEILLAEPNKKRLLNVYNTVGFFMMADNLLTEQVYEKLDENRTRLKLSLFFKNGKMNILSELKMYFAAYVVADIFEDNLFNIKKLNEQAQS